MAPRDPKRSWRESYKKETPSKTRRQISAKVKQTLLSGEGLSTDCLIDCLEFLPDFKGVIPQDFLDKINVDEKMSFIVNIDFSTQPGSHWIGIYLDSKNCYVLDSLGLKLRKLHQGSKPLFRFISRLSNKLCIHFTSCIQNPDSPFCGLYCILFLISFSFTSFDHIRTLFTSDFRLNDFTVLDLLE